MLSALIDGGDVAVVRRSERLSPAEGALRFREREAQKREQQRLLERAEQRLASLRRQLRTTATRPCPGCGAEVPVRQGRPRQRCEACPS